MCQTALGWYEQWLDDPLEGSLLRFLELADWLINNQIVQPELGGVWPVPYGVPIYELTAGWISALVQGQAISVLARAYQETKKDYYLAALKLAVYPFSIPTEFGGIMRFWKEGIFFEEYPSPDGSYVLNGFISSLWGLYDYLLIDDDTEVRILYDEGISTLIKNLPEYDTGYWSLYSQFVKPRLSNLASPYYHKEHIEQLNAYYVLTDAPIFLKYANRWNIYTNNFINMGRIIIAKTLSKISLHY